ncbi:hypothetical protein ATANTOWER_014479 [Ataeniobius toweri]|uniref:Uncharacterized protein n=1 Tax=Ataeniobius toweri TaxID=208326 RepID=A0ABU7AFK4_9TELE|nr:hypothetical protein [Ataeniobius toweri]
MRNDQGQNRSASSKSGTIMTTKRLFFIFLELELHLRIEDTDERHHLQSWRPDLYHVAQRGEYPHLPLLLHLPKSIITSSFSTLSFLSEEQTLILPLHPNLILTVRELFPRCRILI